jgi:putative transposase
MPRRPRLFLPDQPQHVVVRGHNRDPVLIRHEDFRYLYKCLRDAAGFHALAVHAWVFMGNHIHLLVTPSDERSLPRTMQSVGRRYARYFNRTYHRSGSLWEGRYKSGLVDTDPYLLACYRYIELNPVRAGIIRRPEDYPYSSYHANALGRPDGLLTPHPVYLEQSADYPVLFEHVLSSEQLMEIRRGTEKGIGIGQADFLLKVAKLRDKG